MIPSALLLAAAVAGLVWSEARSFRTGVRVAKPLASTVFVGTALAAGAIGSSYGRLVLLALVLSWLGDVLLLGEGVRPFAAGLGSFLLAHLAFAGAFLLLPQEPGPLGVAAVAMVIVGIVVLRWLWPHLPPRLRPAVAAYVGAISLMVTVAAGAAPTAGTLLVLAAAAFAASDVFVARHRFVTPSTVNKAAGLPLYYAAQWVFAWSTGAG